MKIAIRFHLIGRFYLFCRAYPLKRPRRSKQGGVFQDLMNQQEVLHHLRQYDPLNINEPVILDANFYFKKPSKSKSNYPIDAKYGDKDNLEKGLADNLQKSGHIADDRFIIGGQIFKLFGEEDYIEIALYQPRRFQDEISTSKTTPEGRSSKSHDGLGRI